MTESIPISISSDLVLIIAVSLPVLFIFRRLKLPPIAGFVLTGLLIGPYGMGWIQDMDRVHAASEIGVVLLLFTIGLEVSLSRLLETSLRIYLVAFGQVLITAVLGFAAAALLHVPVAAAIVAGFVLAMSSSAIVLKGLADRGELETPLGRLVVTICLAQDFAVVPILMVIGFLSSGSIEMADVLLRIAQVAALGVALYLAARYVLPPVLHRVMTIDTGEVVLLFTMLIMFGTAWLTSLAGLSLAIGAFAAGLILSETEYYTQIYAEVIPFRTLFASVFFVSVGMLVDLGFVMAHPLPVLGVAVGVLFLKSLVVALLAILAGYTPSIGLQAGFYLAQVGEFSFVLMGAATAGRLIIESEFQYMIATATLTLAITPFIMQWAPQLAWQAGSRLPLRRRRKAHPQMEVETPPQSRPKPAVLVVGYGVNGTNVSRVLREAGIYHEILDFNPEVVRRSRDAGELVHYGDLTRPEVLRHIGVTDFDSIVVAISDPSATRRGVSLMRQIHPEVFLIVRTRHVAEVEELAGLGSDIVVPEEFETSLRIFSELLHHYRIPPHIIAMQIELIRGQSYGVLRSRAGSNVIQNMEELLLRRLVEAVFIQPASPAVGRKLSDLGLTDAEGGMVITVLRDGLPLRPPLDETEVQLGDLLVLYGNHADLAQAVQRLAPRPGHENAG